MEDLELERELRTVGGSDDMMRLIENGCFFDGVPEDGGDEAGDPGRLRRKQRNKEAAVRSRQRKKEYVKELERKSEYYEGECRRLWRLLQCAVAANEAQHPHRHLQNYACDANVAKREPAVLSAQNFSLSGGRQVDDTRMVAAAEGGRRREESGRRRETVAGR